ncbi:hypothetical protein C8J57DRAFT_1190786 [Mycena rebaudengoi]|nr:hypothetical protein C8J57DRAFT_1190786 [Mycena rebaudengoi]
MPFFSNTSGVNIHGGTFYQSDGDMHLKNNQQLVIRDSQAHHHYPWAALGASQFSVQGPSTLQQDVGSYNADGGRSLSGVTRNSQQRGTGRSLPYDVSFRHQTRSQRQSSPADDRTYSRLNNDPDDHNMTPLSHLRNVNAPSVEFGSINGVTSSYPTPWFWNTHISEPEMSIHGGTFIEGNVNNVLQSGDTGLQILYRSVSFEAMHDSADNDAQPKCHPETRTKMLEKLYNWCIASEWSRVSDPSRALDDPHREVLIKGLPVLWLYGPAGAGKSAIMRTLAERLASSGQLGGSFFFKRGHPICGNAQKLFATLAYQLADNVPQLRAWISSIVADIPSVVSKSIKVQLQKLVNGPCMQLDTSRPITILIDGLDECNNPDVQQEVLCCIRNLIREQDWSPLQFLIASRPEPHIREIFHGSLFREIHHSFNVGQSLEDVRKYLEDGFAQIHRKHHETMAGVSSPWPSPEVIEYLVEKSSGYFIYAATVIKFIGDRNFRPTERLEAIQDTSHLESSLSALDQLYMQILSTVPARHRLLSILRALDFFEFQLRASGIEQVLQLKSGDVRLTLRNLHSVLCIPEPEHFWQSISMYHASFRDFLNDPTRSGEFYVGGLQHWVDLGKSVLKALSYTYDNPAINLAGPVAL